MIKLAYLQLVWRNNRAFAIFSMFFITLLQFLILYLVTTFDTTSIISVILAQLPEAMRVFLQDSFFSMLNYDGAAAFGFNHPLVLALLVITAVNIPVNHITREIDSGTLELLLAHPFKRSSLILSLWISGSLIILLIISVAMIGSLTSIFLFHNLTGAIFIHIIQIGINLWLFIVLIFSYTTLIAVFGKMGGKTGNISAIISFGFYLLSFLSQIWDALDFTKPFNIFTYYEPQALMFDKGNFILDVIVLIGLIMICFGISLRQFVKRDIP
jgi:ABC-type transport system involved in multi-copper enzyme maturation permease subunit